MDLELVRKIENLNSLLDRTTKRMEMAFGKSQHVILGNQYEHDRWFRLKLNEVALTNQDNEGEKLLPTWPQLSEDLYSALHRTHSVLFDEDQVSPKWRGNRSLMAAVVTADDYERIHDMTMGDPNMVVIAALKVQEGWIEELKRQKQEANNRRQQLEQERNERKKQQGGQPTEGGDGSGLGQEEGRGTIRGLSGDGGQVEGQEPGTGSTGSPGQSTHASGQVPENNNQEEGDSQEAGEGSEQGPRGEQEASQYEPIPEPNNAIEQYQTGLEYTSAMDAAHIALEEAERLAEAGIQGVDVGSLIEQAEAALEAAQALTERMEDQQAYNELVQGSKDISETLRKALLLAVKEAKEQNDTLRAWGIEKGMLKSMDPKAAMELSKLMRSSDALKKIAQLIGNNRISLQKRKVVEKLAHGPTIRVGIDQGRNLNKLVGSQKILMKASPALFRWKYVNNELRQYKTRMEIYQDRGTGVIWIDSSGSMFSGHPFTYSQVAKATAISCMEYLHDEGRDCVVGLFDHGVREVLDIPKEATPLEVLKIKLQIATHDYGGGTDFFEPLMAGFQKIREARYLESADQVLITDGQCYLSTEQVKAVKEAQEETKVNIITVLMPGGRAKQMEQFGPVDTVSTSLQEASKLALSIVKRMDDGYQE